MVRSLGARLRTAGWNVWFTRLCPSLPEPSVHAAKRQVLTLFGGARLLWGAQQGDDPAQGTKWLKKWGSWMTGVSDESTGHSSVHHSLPIPSKHAATRETFGRLDDPVPFLARIEYDQRVTLLKLGHPMKYGPRSTLVRQEEPSHHVIIILGGWTKVTRSAVNGYEALLALRGPGDIVGEAAAIDGRPRSATVTALGEVESVIIERDAFLDHLTAFPATALQLLALAMERTRASDRQRVDQGALGVRERLAILLLDLARTHGDQVPEGVRLTTGLSQHELAGSVGASREAVARLLKELRERGIVRTSRRGIVIVRLEKLRRIERGE